MSSYKTRESAIKELAKIAYVSGGYNYMTAFMAPVYKYCNYVGGFFNVDDMSIGKSDVRGGSNRLRRCRRGDELRLDFWARDS